MFLLSSKPVLGYFKCGNLGTYPKSAEAEDASYASSPRYHSTLFYFRLFPTLRM